MKVRKPTAEEKKQAELWNSWSKEKSEFQWAYDEDEICYILEGEAQVIDDKGNLISFGAGDWVEFPAGLKCTWNITKDIKKRYKLG